MNEITNNQSLTENKYKLHIPKYISKGWQTIRKSTVDFVGMSFLFGIILYVFSRTILVPLWDFIRKQLELRSSYQFLGAFVLIVSVFLLAFFLLSRYYFYFAKFLSDENAAPFSFRLIIADLPQLCMCGFASLSLFWFACTPFFFSLYLRLQDRKMKNYLYSSPAHWEYQLLSLVLIIYVFTYLLFASQLIMFGQLTFVEAIKRSIKIVHKNIFKSLLFSVIVLLIAFSGFLFIYVGAAFTIPLAACILSAAYNDLGEPHAEESDKKLHKLVDSKEIQFL